MQTTPGAPLGILDLSRIEQAVLSLNETVASIGTALGVPALMSLPTAASGIMALTGGQAGAAQLSAEFSLISATGANRGVRLMPAVEGRRMVLANTGPSLLTVFTVGTNTINGIAGGTGIALPPGKLAALICTADGAWYGSVI